MAEKLRVSNRAMGDIYELIVENSSFFIKSFPMQIVVVDVMPKVAGMDLTIGKEIDIRQEQIVCLIGEGYKTGLCLIQNTDNVISILRDAFTGEMHKIKCYNIGSININQVIEGININTQVTGKRLIEMYRHAMVVSKKLNIKTPLIIATLKDGKRRAWRYTAIDENDHPIGDIIYITPQAMPRMIHSVIHELRHCWQEYSKAEEYYKDYKDAWYEEEASYEYYCQPEEIDADAFASLYLNSQGYDGIKMAFEDDEEYKDPFWKEYIVMIKKRMEKIKNDQLEMGRI